jgi:hypothetical protein
MVVLFDHRSKDAYGISRRSLRACLRAVAATCTLQPPWPVVTRPVQLRQLHGHVRLVNDSSSLSECLCGDFW